MKGKSFCFLLFAILIIFGSCSILLWYSPLVFLPLYERELHKKCASHCVQVPPILVITACVSAILCASLNFIFLAGVYSASRKKINNLCGLIKKQWFELMDMLLRILVPKKLLKIVKEKSK